MNNSYVRIL